jgi:hypothetical protein
MAATNPTGTTVVVYGRTGTGPGEPVSRVDAVRVRGGRLLGRQRLTTIGERNGSADHAAVSPTTAGGFQARWNVFGPKSREYVGIGTVGASGGSGGAFARGLLTAWPPGWDPASFATGTQTFVDPRGDEAAWWTRPEGGEEAETMGLYVTSRRKGGGFTSAQLVGQIDNTDQPATAMSPAGEFTVGWLDEKRIYIATGQTGHTAITHFTSVGNSTPSVALTTSGETVIGWSNFRPNGQVLEQATTSRDGLHFSRPHTFFSGRSPCLDLRLTADQRGGVLAGVTCAPHGRRTEVFLYYHR